MQIFQTAERAFGWLSRVMSYLATIFLTIMMLLVTADVFCRYILNRPIRGSIEIVEYLMIVVGSLGLAYCALQGQNISVGAIVDRFPIRVQRVFDIFSYILAFFIFALLGWRTTLESIDMMVLYKEITDVLEIPSYPFYFLLSFGFCLLCIAILIRLIQTIKQVAKK